MSTGARTWASGLPVHHATLPSGLELSVQTPSQNFCARAKLIPKSGQGPHLWTWVPWEEGNLTWTLTEPAASFNFCSSLPKSKQIKSFITALNIAIFKNSTEWIKSIILFSHTFTEAYHVSGWFSGNRTLVRYRLLPRSPRSSREDKTPLGVTKCRHPKCRHQPASSRTWRVLAWAGLFLVFLSWGVPSVEKGILLKCLELHCPLESSAVLEMFFF